MQQGTAKDGKKALVSWRAVFLFHHRKYLVVLKHESGRLSYEKNAPRGSHCVGKEDVAKVTRRRRRIQLHRIL